MNPAAILAAAATAATITLAGGSFASAAEVTPTTCLLHVHPFDDMSRRLEVVTPTGTQVLLSVQDNRTTLGGERTFELDGDVTRVHWTWNRAAGTWRVDLGVAPGCQMDPYPYWQDGSHPASLSMTVGQVPTTTTTAPTTTTTAPVPTTTTTAEITTTTGPTPTTVPPQPVVVQRVTPSPTDTRAATPPRAPQLPATGRNEWPKVRITLALFAIGAACLQLAQIMRQDAEDGQ